MKTRLVAVALAAVLAWALAGCALQVRSDVNRAAFHPGQCKSFAWAGAFRTDNPMRGTIANPVNESRLRAAITTHMQAAGIPLVAANSDCLVGYGVGSSTAVDWYPGGGPYGPFGYGYWGWGGPWGPYGAWGWDMPYVYRQGTIDIDLYDAKTREPLWHASVDQDLYRATGPEAERRIDVAVDALFTKFPG